MSQAWARSPEGRLLTKRGVPDGSCEFQRALDYFLSVSDSDNDEDQIDEVDYTACGVNGSGTPEIYLTRADSSDSLDQTNIGISERESSDKNKSVCQPGTNIRSLDPAHDAIRLGRGESQDTSYRLSPVGAVSNPKSSAAETSNRGHLYNCEEGKRRVSSPIKLPSITAHQSPTAPHSGNNSTSPKHNMGSNCSANIHHASGEFSNVIPHPVRLSKGGESKSSLCACNQSHDTPHWAVRTNKNAHITSGSINGHTKSEYESHHSLSIKKGPSRSTDSSPQRLLPKRSHSFNSHSVSPTKKNLEREHKHTRVNELIISDGEMRGRSHSWSNGNSGKKLLRHSPVSIRFSSHCNKESEINDPIRKEPSTSVVSLESDTGTTSQQAMNETPHMSHSPNCPLYREHTDGDTVGKSLGISASQTILIEDLDEELPPLLRKRAASESHTLKKSRQVRTSPSPLAYSKTSDGDPPEVNHHDFHVHWADEENLSLSTSVILTRLRPRSYSHGAVDMMPHRPILKKVSGLL